MAGLNDWLDSALACPRTRALTPHEHHMLRAQGNRGELSAVRLGPMAGPGTLERVFDNTFAGPVLLLGPAVHIESSRLARALIGAAQIVRSEVEGSVVGDDVSVVSGSVVEGSALQAYRRRGASGAHSLPILVRASFVSGSVVWGGSDLGPHAHARSHSVVGPFAHIGTGSELKAACVLGATPRNRIELPHRSYFGNASAKALLLREAFGTEAYLQALRIQLPVLLGARLDWTRAEETVPGAVQPRERLGFTDAADDTFELEVQGVNLGALTTTSNFDPRNGGTKMPTNLEAGVRFGVLAIAQAPSHVPPGVLVASGAKLTGGNVAPGSLVLPVAGQVHVLPEYVEANEGRLGDGVLEVLALTRAYIRQLIVYQECVAQLAWPAAGLERVALWRTAAALDGQCAELCTWLERYLALCEQSAATLAEDLAREASEERRERLSARLHEQRRAVGLAHAQRVELDALRGASAAVTHETEALTEPAQVLDAAALACARRAFEDRAFWKRFSRASEEESAALEAAARELTARPDAPRLFGTSGIRGRFAATSRDTPVAAFVTDGVITPALSYLTGRALAHVLERTLGAPVQVLLATDVRASGPALASAMREGLRDGGARTRTAGVATTPATVAFAGDAPAVIITASHNPAPDNGIKVFVSGRPLSRTLEREVESEVRALEAHARAGRAPNAQRSGATRPIVAEGACDVEHHQRMRLRATAQRLGLTGALRGHVLSLDLARGAAAASMSADGVLRLSPALAHWCDEGVIVLAYGAARDADRVNDRIGAGYVYGEGRARGDGGAFEDVRPAQGELAAFARGLPGYGRGEGGSESAPRVLFWPADIPMPPELERHARRVEETLLDEGDAARAGTRAVFLDEPDVDDAARSALEHALLERPCLPALAVDGDADRTVITDTQLASRAVPYLTGDDLLRLFATYGAQDGGAPLECVAFTVESGLGLEKFFEARGIPVDVTTVGDRAIAERLLARTGGADGAPGWCVGGEPSGHVLLVPPQREHTTDDPFALHLHAVALARGAGRSLGALLSALDEGALDPHTARKPDAWAKDPERNVFGLSLAEKSALELTTQEGRLSPYAAALIADYAPAFGAAYAHLHADEATSVRFAARPLLDAMLASPIAFDAEKSDVTIGELTWRGEGALEVTLQLAGAACYGPSDIVLRFWAHTAAGARTKVGELVARNSGTSPKNAAYHKLWPVHPTREVVADEGRVREALDALAKVRADFTDRWVREVLRA